jgi:hypothetical protein
MAGRVLTAAKAMGSPAWQTPQAVFKPIFVPWRPSYEPTRSFLNSESEYGQIGSWHDRKLVELTFVRITVRFIVHLFLAFEIAERKCG